MNIETVEINGFIIDTFNQYNLEEGKTQGICPLCSSTRKPENRKTKCASYDWERGLGTCHNCNTTFQLHTYQRKGASEKEYVRPGVDTIMKVNSKVEEWFKSRGISKQTLKDLRVSEGKEWMPHTGKSENTIRFNYFICQIYFFSSFNYVSIFIITNKKLRNNSIIIFKIVINVFYI